jgi:hypothetical protein
MSGKFENEKTAEFTAEQKKVVFLFEKMQATSRPTLAVKGINGFFHVPDAFSMGKSAYEELDVIPGLTYQLTVRSEDYSSGATKADVFISMFQKEA